MDVQVNPFDNLAPFYDSWFDTPEGSVAGALERSLLLRLAGPVTGERVLDVGAGTGWFTQAFAGAGAQVVGLDVSLAMLRVAAGKGLAISLVRADAHALPFQPEAFDLVYAVTVLEFLPDPERVVAGMWSAVRAGGRLVIAVLNRWSPWARRKAPPFDQARFYSPPELKRLLEPYGRVAWSSSVFFLPGGQGLRAAGPLERIGRACLRPFGALLAAGVEKPHRGG
jgi:SAM-dependent methyltransferase